MEIRESRKITAAEGLAGEPMHTTETINPEEAAHAIKEARERLASFRPPASPTSTPPPMSSSEIEAEASRSAPTGAPPAAAPAKSSLGPIVLAIIATAVIVVGIMLAMR